jgi:hypothetical protein
MLQIRNIKFGQFLEKIWIWTQELLAAQFFLSLFSWPILLWWGLPLSWLTLLGNLFFNPFIMVFLLFSVFLFFFELLGLPSGIWVFLLEQLTSLWLWLVAWGSHRALVAFPCPPAWFLALMPLGAVTIAYSWRKFLLKRTVLLGLFLFCMGIFLKLLFVASPGIYSVSAGQRSLRFVYTGDQAFLIDQDAVLRNGGGLISWVDFKLRPFLVKKFGLTSCDALIIMRPTQARLKAAAVVARRLRIPVIMVPAEEMAGVLAPELTHTVLVQLSAQELNQQIGLAEARPLS